MAALQQQLEDLVNALDAVLGGRLGNNPFELELQRPHLIDTDVRVFGMVRYVSPDIVRRDKGVPPRVRFPSGWRKRPNAFDGRELLGLQIKPLMLCLQHRTQPRRDRTKNDHDGRNRKFHVILPHGVAFTSNGPANRSGGERCYSS